MVVYKMVSQLQQKNKTLRLKIQVEVPSIENMGPIPPGWYIIYPSEIEEGNVNFLEKKMT